MTLCRHRKVTAKQPKPANASSITQNIARQTKLNKSCVNTESRQNLHSHNWRGNPVPNKHPCLFIPNVPSKVAKTEKVQEQNDSKRRGQVYIKVQKDIRPFPSK